MSIENTCEKKAFKTSKEAQGRGNEINQERKSSGQEVIKFRPYWCESCGEYHLTSMTKHRYKLSHDIAYRNKVRHEKLLKREAEYWHKKFGLEGY